MIKQRVSETGEYAVGITHTLCLCVCTYISITSFILKKVLVALTCLSLCDPMDS